MTHQTPTPTEVQGLDLEEMEKEEMGSAYASPASRAPTALRPSDAEPSGAGPTNLGQTDFLTDPDTLDAFMEANPLPPDIAVNSSDGSAS